MSVMEFIVAISATLAWPVAIIVIIVVLKRTKVD